MPLPRTSLSVPRLAALAFSVVALAMVAGCKSGGGGAEPAAPAAGAAAGFQVDPNFVSNGVAERAATNFATHCVSCHGPNGDGAGPVGSALQPPPTNFTAAEVPAHRAFEAIRGGGMAVGKAATMPSFESTLSEQDIHDLVAYVQAFAN